MDFFGYSPTGDGTVFFNSQQTGQLWPCNVIGMRQLVRMDVDSPYYPSQRLKDAQFVAVLGDIGAVVVFYCFFVRTHMISRFAAGVTLGFPN